MSDDRAVSITLPAVATAANISPAQTWLARYTNPGSRKTMLKALSTVAEVFAGHPVTDLSLIPWAAVTYQHALAVNEALRKMHYAPSTVNRCMGALRGIIEECVRLDLTPSSVAMNVKGIPPMRESTKKAGRALSDEECAKLYSVCEGDAVSRKRDRAVLVMTHLMGMRRSEACGVQLKDWLIVEGRARVEVLGKRNKYRTLYLDSSDLHLMEPWLQARGTKAGPLLCAVSQVDVPNVGAPLTASGLYRVLESVGRRAGIDSFSPHDLRRTYITKLLSLNVDTLTVAEMAGHDSVATTQRYDRRSDEAKKAATRKLAESRHTVTTGDDDEDEDE